MHKRAKPRLPYRLRSEGWWLVDPPRAKPAAIVIPFLRPYRAGKSRMAAVRQSSDVIPSA
ncbi:hypothetical protein FJW08_29935 [Mesorhizobium sp. B3-2-1]|nr:hypothetical protein FJW08_29935 [Mesorhizobium sp. B3-2-1]